MRTTVTVDTTWLSTHLILQLGSGEPVIKAKYNLSNKKTSTFKYLSIFFNAIRVLFSTWAWFFYQKHWRWDIAGPLLLWPIAISSERRRSHQIRLCIRSACFRSLLHASRKNFMELFVHCHLHLKIPEYWSVPFCDVHNELSPFFCLNCSTAMFCCWLSDTLNQLISVLQRYIGIPKTMFPTPRASELSYTHLSLHRNKKIYLSQNCLPIPGLDTIYLCY